MLKNKVDLPLFKILVLKLVGKHKITLIPLLTSSLSFFHLIVVLFCASFQVHFSTCENLKRERHSLEFCQCWAAVGAQHGGFIDEDLIILYCVEIQ